ncbi:fungal-specific transcription factor domain-containing protein [Peziza echinospora]|nr:fungal-specific transcription factor domain-containing protein [Peziza echinospora]
MSPPQDYGRVPGGPHPHYITGIESRQQSYRHSNPHAHDIHHPPLQADHIAGHGQVNAPGVRQPEFSLPRPLSNSITPEQNGILRSINQGYNPHSQSSGLVSPKQDNLGSYEPPNKRVKTEEHGGSLGASSDQDTEDEEDMYSEGRGGSGEPDGKKRKYSGMAPNRPTMPRKRSSTRPLHGGLGEDGLPTFVDGVRVNKEWGLTKAGKARQRLPQACIACRKKKIKCIISKGQINCEKCKQQGMTCEFKASTSSRSKGNSAAPETDDGHSRMDGSYTDGTPSRDLRDDPLMQDPGDLKNERDNDASEMEYEMHARKSSSYMQDDNSGMNIEPADSQPNPMFVTDGMSVMAPTTHSQIMEHTRQVHVREMAAQWQSQSTGRRHHSVGVASTPSNHVSSPSSPGSADILPYGTPKRRYYSSTQSRTATSSAGTPVISSVSAPLSEELQTQLPSEEILRHLVSLYFSHVYSQHYPFLHKATFMKDLTSHRPVLLFSLCAITARFSEKYRHMEDHFTVQARQLILEHFDDQKLEVVQALLLMGLHDFGSNNGHKAWMFAGMAVRLGAAMNLNMESKDKSKTPLEIEVQRRTYWSYYLMDRLNSYGTSRPFLTQDHDCHIQLPCDQSSFENQRIVYTEHLQGENPHHPEVGNENMGAFAYLVRITSIWGDVLKYIHLSNQASTGKAHELEPDQEFLKFVDRLKGWESSLPAGLRYSNDNLKGQIRAGTVGAFVMMHVMYHTSAAYVYRYVTIGARPGDPKELITNDPPTNSKDYIISSIRKIFVHADSVMQIMTHVWQRKKEAEKSGTEPVTVVAPFIGQAVLDACMVGVIRATITPSGGKGAEALKNRVITGLSWLRELKKYWKPMGSMYDKLKKAIKNWERKSGKTTIPESSSGAGSASVSPKQIIPQDHGIMLSPDTANHMRVMTGGLLSYQSESPIEYSFEQGNENYIGFSDLVYDVPFVYYVDALSGQGAVNSINQYAWDEGLFPNIFPDLLTPTTLGGPSIMGGIGNEQQLTAMNGSLLTQSPVSHTSSSTHQQYRSSNHRSTETGSQHSPAASQSSMSPSSESESDDDDDDDDNEVENQNPEAEKNFGSQYFAARANRMEILHCLNLDDEEVRKAAEQPEEDIIGGDGGDSGDKVAGVIVGKYSKHPPGGADAAMSDVDGAIVS